MLSKVRLERVFTWGQIMLNNKDYRFTKIDADTLNDIAKELKLLAHQVYDNRKTSKTLGNIELDKSCHCAILKEDDSSLKIG